MDEFSLETMTAYLNDLAESVPKDAPESDFADPPSGLYVGDAKHARLAVQAVTSGLRGNKAKSRSDPGVKSKIASAIRKFYQGEQQKYYLSWLHSGKKPDQKPMQEMFMAPPFSFRDAPSMPEVPFAEGVNLDALTKNDPDPMFITRPLAVVGGVSENGLVYDDFLVDTVVEQINTKRPPARNGHIPLDQKTWNAGVSVGRWVGAIRVGGTAYGKAYIYPGTPFYADMRAAEAAGSELSNSIYGDNDVEYNPDGTHHAVQVVLESVDFVPPERAALKALGGEFEVTSEMTTEVNEMAETHDDAAQDEALFKQLVAKHDAGKIHEMLHEAGKVHPVAEMHFKGGCAECDANATARFRETAPEETYKSLSEATRKHVAECYAKESGFNLTPAAEVSQTLAEMTNAKTELGKMQQALAEMGQTIKRYERQEFEATLDKAIDGFYTAILRTPKAVERQDNIKRIHRKSALVEMAGMDGGQIATNIQAAVEKTWEEEAKSLSEMNLAAAGGPPVVTGTATIGGQGQRAALQGFDPATNRFTDEFMAEALRQAGVASRRNTTGGDQ